VERVKTCSNLFNVNWSAPPTLRWDAYPLCKHNEKIFCPMYLKFSSIIVVITCEKMVKGKHLLRSMHKYKPSPSYA